MVNCGRAWKLELAALALEAGLEITACHFPPGTSKWNKIEDRLFAHITMNWRGRPLTSHDVIVASIAATTTRGGLTVRAGLGTGTCPPGAKISNEQVAALPMVATTGMATGTTPSAPSRRPRRQSPRPGQAGASGPAGSTLPSPA